MEINYCATIIDGIMEQTINQRIPRRFYWHGCIGVLAVLGTILSLFITTYGEILSMMAFMMAFLSLFIFPEDGNMGKRYESYRSPLRRLNAGLMISCILLF